ncbi:hypothetical protein HD554DRAFT_2036527 [Boletus coccyginus]|nr:hypothetical protein HD554DRAFT_2036527 [Boletus coccyginus]
MPEMQHTEVEKVDDSPNKGIANPEKTVQELHNKSRQTHQEWDDLIQSLRAQAESSNSKIAWLEKIVQELCDKLAESQHAANLERDRLDETINSLRSLDENSSGRIAHVEQTNQELRVRLADTQRKADSLVRINHAHEQMRQCKSLYAQGRIQGAAECLLEFANTLNEDVRANQLTTDRPAEFMHWCITALERIGDDASNAAKRDEAVAAYSTALSLGPSTPNAILTKWGDIILIHGSADEASSAATKFKVPRFVVYRVICDILERDGRLTEAVECFRRMQNELPEDMGVHDERAEWELDFNARCMKGLGRRGDVAMDSASYDDAVAHYSTALRLDPLSADLLTKQSKARAGSGSWADSLEDADAAIKLKPSSPCGHERKHAALLGAHRYDEALDAYNNMLLMLEQSSDPVSRELRKNYVGPSQTKAAIRSAVKRTQRDAPLVQINTGTGQVCDQRERVDEFEADPKFVELVASMTTRLDHSRIRQVVQEYFRYATFSHTWQGAEPLFHDVLHGSVHKLAESPTVLKLVMLCTTVQEAGFRLGMESLTSMFKWYHESSLTIVHLKGVRSGLGTGWTGEESVEHAKHRTLQEFFASRVIRFYTEDWKPYRPDEKVYNHKDSPAIMAEMARATGTDVYVLLSLRPGSDDVRQKRHSMAKGQQRAVGCLLQEVLTRSGDVTILAWTGKASDYNSCLPAEISVYREPASPYVPLPIEDCKMDGLVAELRTWSKIVDSAMVLYDRVVVLPSCRKPRHDPNGPNGIPSRRLKRLMMLPRPACFLLSRTWWQPERRTAQDDFPVTSKACLP